MADFNTLLAEVVLPIPAIVPANYTGSAQNGPYCSLKNYNSVVVMFITGAWAGGTAAVTLAQATAVAGTNSKALAYSVDGPGTGPQANLWSNTTSAYPLTATAITSNTWNLSTANTLYFFEVFARSLDISNGFDCFRVAVASPGVNADYYGCWYLFRQPRFAQGGTVLPDPTVD